MTLKNIYISEKLFSFLLILGSGFTNRIS